MDSALMSKRLKLVGMLANVFLFLYISTINLIPHSGRTISIIFALAGVVLFFRSQPKMVITSDEKWVLWVFGLFPVVYLFSFILNGLPEGLDFSFKYIGDELRMLLIIPVFLFFRQISISGKAIWNGILAGALISGLYGILFFTLRPTERVSGSYDAIAFGALSLVLAVMSIASYGSLSRKHRMYQLVIPSAFILGLTACLLSGSRGVWASAPMLLVVLFFFLGKYFTTRIRIMFIGMSCLMLIIAYWIPATNIAQRVDSALFEIREYWNGDVHYGGATVRILGLRAATAVFLTHPIIGAGPGNYKSLVDQMIAQNRLHEMTAQHSEPASTLLSTAASCGILGLLALMGLFMAPLWVSFKWIRSHSAYRSVGYSLMLLVLAFFQFGLSEIIFRRSLYTHFYFILVAAFMALAANIRDRLTGSPTPHEIQ
jgi:O-antigen ligase